jgi:hypothetical protein
MDLVDLIGVSLIVRTYLVCTYSMLSITCFFVPLHEESIESEL